MDTFWHLEKEDFFKGIDEAKSAFLKNAQRLELSKNEMVFLEGDAGDSCFYIESGLIRIFCMDRAGKEMTFSLRMKGEIFGISEVLNNSPRKASAQTASASVLYAINRQDFESMLQEHYPLARSVITLLGRRLRQMGDLVRRQNSDVANRLASLLISLAYETLRTTEGWNKPCEIPLSIPQEQLASMVGSTQPTVSATLQQFRNAGLIVGAGRRIVLLNPIEMIYRLDHNLL
ncbi:MULTISPECIES: Crp/Fnr family transcriptional regulator [Desulfovibrio]|uniref:Cyclic nucleotide-binding domain protein n=2 Tax=root TaxID=1 RepID=A0A212KBV7_9BACT|nr:MULTISPECIES: Crp/Fnr family transcriptional regulator [Desulfovibrio]MBD8897072.1 Crp/Fnr family transcriptional regulator [Desulfovibrio desulfuricans]MBT9749626.1 cyclic nucleotide-binding domain-containing protein [Desulfovibrio desulfuricans]MCB6542780.1 Crp/Fnr family transcriptional regulator [Desulfovibrio desulfuricans]MCB6553742.1 Crp/Fnr family transcriptional regulator [Desulfovibrio desulfuricans]MCB6564839.1 Crp/Fnr family transcriptional regulator [Desulfovibrio desulfuricans